MLDFYKLRGAGGQPQKGSANPCALHSLLFAFLATILWSSCAEGAVRLSLSTASGAAVAGARPNYTTDFGNVNGLGVGVPGAGMTVLTTGVAGGVIYSTSYNLDIANLPGSHLATVSVYVSANFGKPTLLNFESCYPSAGCGSGGSFTTISLSSAAPTAIIGGTGVSRGTYTANLGLFVSNSNGAGISSGADTATLTFVATDTTNGRTSRVNLALSPSLNLQTAVQLLLATAPGGLTVTPAADFSMDYGNVNGLGIAPGAGLTVSAAPGGVIYATPYLMQPSFSTFSSTTSSLSVYVSMDFAHPAILQLNDAALLAGPYTAISKIAGAPTTLVTTAGSASNVTRYLGLFVSSANGAGTFTGADSATLTYTMTVP